MPPGDSGKGGGKANEGLSPVILKMLQDFGLNAVGRGTARTPLEASSSTIQNLGPLGIPGQQILNPEALELLIQLLLRTGRA